MFKSELDAALAYNEAAIKYFDDFAYLNIIPEEIPKPKREFKDGAYYPYYYGERKSVGAYHSKSNRIGGVEITDPYITWIGEEINIDWGKL